MMGLDNPVHIAFLLVIVLLVFGAKRLPEMGHSLGAGLRGFKESLTGETHTTELGAGTEGPRFDALTENHTEPATDSAEPERSRVSRVA